MDWKDEILPHVLLGNGFSIAFSQSYNYERLLELPVFDDMALDCGALIKSAGTADVETLMEYLRHTQGVMPAYVKRADKIKRRDFPSHDQFVGLVKTIRHDYSSFRGGQVRAIDYVSPTRELEYPHTLKINCRKWLRNFEDVYTLNYDLLLPDMIYRTIGNRKRQHEFLEGRARRKGGTEATQPYYWNREYLKGGSRVRHQRVFYLHGALHIVDTKRSFINTHWRPDKRVVMLQPHSGYSFAKCVSDYLKEHELAPTIVLEALSKEKMAAINSTTYLQEAYRNLASAKGYLISYGCSLGPRDGHICRAITDSGVRRFYFGVFRGDMTDSQWHNHCNNELHRVKTSIPRKDVRLWQTDSSSPWGDDWKNQLLLRSKT